MRYAVVTPARNERDNLIRLTEALSAQTLLPERWIVVDDGSDDGTDAVVAELAATRSWMRLLSPEAAVDGALTEGRRGGRALIGFRRGVRALERPVDVVVKVDADTSFDPDYFEVLIGRFAQSPDLGIAGGSCYELENGRWERKRVAATHPRGASRAYRWPCVQAALELESKMGWDGLDEVRAELLGYRTQVFTDIGFRHHRLTGGRERGRLRAQSAMGEASWYMGYRPSYLLLRTLYRSRRDALAFGMLWGYGLAAVTRTPRCPDASLVRRLRERQQLRRVFSRGLPP